MHSFDKHSKHLQKLIKGRNKSSKYEKLVVDDVDNHSFNFEWSGIPVRGTKEPSVQSSQRRVGASLVGGARDIYSAVTTGYVQNDRNSSFDGTEEDGRGIALPKYPQKDSLSADIDDEPLLSFNAVSANHKIRHATVGCFPSLWIHLHSYLLPLISFFFGQRVCTVKRIIWLFGGTSPMFLAPNIVRNTRYNIFTLIPGVLINQFSFFLNLFYLGVALTQLIPQLRIGPLFTYFVPLSFVLFISIFKEGYDDFHRYLRDREINGSLYEVWDTATSSIVLKTAQDLVVGDIIQLHENQRVPCDALLLQVHTVAEITFIRTDQLDGETDWKLRRPVACTQTLSLEKDLKDTLAWVTVEPPRKDIYEFTGSFFMEKKKPLETSKSLEVYSRNDGIAHEQSGERPLQGSASNNIVDRTESKIPETSEALPALSSRCISSLSGITTPQNNWITESLSLENMLWGTTVVTSGPVCVLAVYTGCDSRAMLNTSANRSKTGIFDQEINTLSKSLFCILISVATAMTFLKGISGIWFLTLFRFMLLLSSIIPISLRVNLDLAKAYYSRIISSDSKVESTVVRNSSIPEELGRIDILLTDKTGTLTQNDMVLKKLHIGDAVFTIDCIADIQTLFEKSFFVDPTELKESVAAEQSLPNSSANSSVLHSAGSSSLRISRRHRVVSRKLHKTLIALAVCHNVTPILEEMSGKISYQASSPDEMAIVTFAAITGLNLVERTNSVLTLMGPRGITLEFELLFVFPFSSETKRMGCIVRHRANRTQSLASLTESEGKIFFFLKGAEVVMIPFLERRESDWLQEECDNFARSGLRTLVIASRELSQGEFDAFVQSYSLAQISMQGRSERVAAAISLLERDMTLLALTGVEDRLQTGVPQTLEAFRHAGIKIWMLTGDKVETATCVAISAGLKTRQQQFVKFSISDFSSIDEAQEAIEKFSLKASDCVLVTDSSFLNIALMHFPVSFITVACQTPATICCRCSPTQKADITRLIQIVTGKRTAAVGDGGNDVSMILASHCGIGIVGSEGKQASLVADFSVSQFQHIHRLVLWHGRNCYQRSAKLAQFVMHRGLVIATIQIIFSAVFFYIPMAIFQGWLIMGYTTYYTMLPVFSLVLDTELSESIVFMFPELYTSLRGGRVMSQKTLFAWLWASVYQGAVIMLGAILLFESEFTNIISITFTSLIFAEMLNVASTVSSCHILMITAQIVTLGIYLLSMVFLPTYFNLKFICSWTFCYKVLIITLVSWFPLHCIKLLIRCLQPTRDSKLML